MGSFFMALFGFIRFMYELLTPEDKGEQEGCMANWKKFCNCCCFLCIKFIFDCFNTGAYTFIHLAGENYCTSAWEIVSYKIKEPVCTAVVSFMSVVNYTLILVILDFDPNWHHRTDSPSLLHNLQKRLTLQNRSPRHNPRQHNNRRDRLLNLIILRIAVL